MTATTETDRYQEILQAAPIVAAGSHHQAVLVWHSNDLFCMETFVVAWRLLINRAEPVFAEDTNACTAILMRGPDGLLSDLNGSWGTYPDLDAFKADYRARCSRCA